jgi:hypothetical protein
LKVVYHRGKKRIRAFLLGNMPAVFKYNQLCDWQLFCQLDAVPGWNDTVIISGHNQDWNTNLVKLVREVQRLAGFGQLPQSPVPVIYLERFFILLIRARGNAVWFMPGGLEKLITSFFDPSRDEGAQVVHLGSLKKGPDPGW